MIYIFDFRKHTNLNLFSSKFFLLCCDLQQVDKCAFVNKDKTFIFFSLPDPAKIWLLQLDRLWT